MLFQERGPDAIGAGAGQEDAIAVENLAHQIEGAAQTLAAIAIDSHSPGHLRKAELRGISSGKARIGEVGCKETVVLRRQRTALVIEPIGQADRVIEQHQAGIVRDQLGVRSVPHRAAVAPLQSRLASLQCATWRSAVPRELLGSGSAQARAVGDRGVPASASQRFRGGAVHVMPLQPSSRTASSDPARAPKRESF